MCIREKKDNLILLFFFFPFFSLFSFLKKKERMSHFSTARTPVYSRFPGIQGDGSLSPTE